MMMAGALCRTYRELQTFRGSQWIARNSATTPGVAN
jgi:hypothetical protein